MLTWTLNTFFRYIIEDPLIEIDNLLAVIKCLTRITYHSYEATVVIIKTPKLLEILFANCQFAANNDKMYVAKLMILLRVLACRANECAVAVTQRLNLLPFLLNIIGDSTTKTSTASQCIYMWQVLLRHHIGYETVSELVPVFYNLISLLHSINGGNMEKSVIMYATSLLSLLTYLFERFYETVRFLIPMLEQLCCQWINVLAVEKHVSREFTKMLANCVFLLVDVEKRNSLSLTAFNIQMKILTNVNVYTEVTRDLTNSSYILNASKREYVESLPSLCVPIRILGTNNNLVLVHSIVKYGLCNGDNAFARGICNDNLWQYVDQILKLTNLAEVSALWGARYEIFFLCDLLELCSKWDAFLDRKLLELAFTLVRCVHADDAYLIGGIFSGVLFNPKVYQQMITPDDSNFRDALSDLENMKKYFLKELSLPTITSDDLMSSRSGTDSVLSTDWHYLPILKISNNKETEVNVPVESISPVLKWIYLVEYFSEYIQINISLAARYCRVACVFFCGDVFLDVVDILYAILKQILKHNDRLDFSENVAGISSFYDFYRELCEQFASSSYCNPVFCQYILVPLQQKHDCQYRKYVWLEQAVLLRFISLPENELVVPIECFLQPVEEDVQLIEAYLRIVATGL